MMRRVNILCSFALLFASHTSLAVTYPLPPEGSRLVGQSLTVTVPEHNTQPLETFAAQYGQGLSNMLEANTGADVFLPKSGSQLTIPQQLILPAFVPAGPDNPMGLYAIYIGRLYAIHGTNANFGIGLRVSQGCIRLRNDDIKYLFDNVPVGTRVQIIDQPVKYTTEPDGSKWLEVHEPLSRNRAEYESDRKVPLPVTPSLRAFINGQEVDVNRANAALQRRSGMPVQISSGSRQMF
ncbi:TPA: L,D-transpeptidase family protein [Escherichia coli]|nr:L,D-transpeptidase family protein [Escherichia coli]